jgi:gluconolactonase
MTLIAAGARHTVAAVCVAALFASSLRAQLRPGEVEAVPMPIPDVIDAAARWELVWSDTASADGIVGDATGVYFAQEQTDRVVFLDNEHREHTLLEDVYGVGAVSLDSSGRLFAVERTCTEPLNPELARCNVLTRVVQLLPERRVLANRFADGRPLGRLNDLIADGNGGAYFTAGGLYHASGGGLVTVIAEGDVTTNGLMLSANGRVLYVTNVTEVLAFDVGADGSARNRRVFATLAGDNGGDGIALDDEGRLYVTATTGVHVLASDGEHLGLIPTPRRPITAAFAGADKSWLYVPQIGAVGPDGRAFTTPEGVRNIAMSIYRIGLLTPGLGSRPK